MESPTTMTADEARKAYDEVCANEDIMRVHYATLSNDDIDGESSDVRLARVDQFITALEKMEDVVSFR
ncbi:MAG: hypothetical protein LBR22_11615 [Desulfovibrio sp.]|jgi:hypothetical protein|nr:hypothetical protein [Desulfovibrio sp.]